MKASATSTGRDFASVSLAASLLLLVLSVFSPSNEASAQALCAQGDVGCRLPRPGQVPPTPPVGKPAALLDLEGQWVAVVTEDWRSYMITAPKGDYESMPLNGIGRQVADAWNPDATDTDACMAYGAAAIMRMPSRFRISWESDDILKIETDAGMQVRKLNFKKSAEQQAAPSRQGYSFAKWVQEGEPVGKKTFGTLEVTTSNLLAGYLRKNGVPFSDKAVVTEYYDRFKASTGEDWLVVTTLVDDPQYLYEPFTTSTHLMKDPRPASWKPEPCLRGKPGIVK
ncbi:MAG: hypothetical protein ABL964_08580 [Steroidobacteraceae bacterium]